MRWVARSLLGGVALVARVELRCREAVFLGVDFLLAVFLTTVFFTAVLLMVFLAADFLGAVFLATGFFAARGIVGVADEKFLKFVGTRIVILNWRESSSMSGQNFQFIGNIPHLIYSVYNAVPKQLFVFKCNTIIVYSSNSEGVISVGIFLPLSRYTTLVSCIVVLFGYHPY